MSTMIKNKKFIDKNFDLLLDFSRYMDKIGYTFELPEESTIVFFDDTDELFNEYSSGLIKGSLNRGEKTIKVIKTGLSRSPWRIGTIASSTYRT